MSPLKALRVFHGCETNEMFLFLRYLLADEAEAAVLPDALVRFPQHRVEGLVAVPEGGGGVTGDGEGSDVNLQEIKDKHKSKSNKTDQFV